jgi:S-adenosylmethionine:tRNA ribosyltransferase-isomerase
MHPRELSIADFTYDLPDSRIAAAPLAIRDQSKLLVYRAGKIETSSYHQISEYLPNNSLLIFNNTKVIQARILFKKDTGGIIEIFCLEPDEPEKDFKY